MSSSSGLSTNTQIAKDSHHHNRQPLRKQLGENGAMQQRQVLIRGVEMTSSEEMFLLKDKNTKLEAAK